jgi:hypothetical protein
VIERGRQMQAAMEASGRYHTSPEASKDGRSRKARPNSLTTARATASNCLQATETRPDERAPELRHRRRVPSGHDN